MALSATAPRSRLVIGALVVLLHAAIAWLLLARIDTPQARSLQRALHSFDVIPPPRDRARPVRPRRPRPAPKAAPAPPNLRQQPAPVVVPPLPVRLPVPPVIAVAPVAGAGAAPAAGASDRPGAGTGAAGDGNGRGGGGAGGDGDDAGYTPPRQIRGRLRAGDFVRSDEEMGATRRVGVRYLVEVDGHVSECEVTSPSGNAALDANTCRLIMERFRFRPSRDPQGRPVPGYVVETHGWYVENPGPDGRR